MIQCFARSNAFPVQYTIHIWRARCRYALRHAPSGSKRKSISPSALETRSMASSQSCHIVRKEKLRVAFGPDGALSAFEGQATTDPLARRVLAALDLLGLRAMKPSTSVTHEDSTKRRFKQNPEGINAVQQPHWRFTPPETYEAAANALRAAMSALLHPAVAASRASQGQRASGPRLARYRLPMA